jgi:hypothetical protein
MATTANRQVLKALNGYEMTVVATFVTTGSTVTFSTSPFPKNDWVKIAGICPIKPSTLSLFYVTNANGDGPDIDGKVKVDVDGTLTLNRTVATDSGLSVAIRLVTK